MFNLYKAYTLLKIFNGYKSFMYYFDLIIFLFLLKKYFINNIILCKNQLILLL